MVEVEHPALGGGLDMPHGSVVGERVTTPRGLVLEWTGEAWLVISIPNFHDARAARLYVWP